ncbi:hypothetical protein [Caballeronia sp. NK8]|uniref:hypothetical protein n=1 Tax=Caballeronia sp. NK8 TaxID=140098 RepID=UPI001BCFFA9E|nr:hypothetical protein [Caballeronia sp. NK8]
MNQTSRKVMRFTAWSAIIGGVLAYANVGLSFAVTGPDADMVLHGASMLALPPNSRELFRWCMVADTLGFYLPFVVIGGYFVHAFREELGSLGSMVAMAVALYVMVGVTGAVMQFATLHPLAHLYAGGDDATRSAAAAVWTAIANATQNGLWWIEGPLVLFWTLIAANVLKKAGWKGSILLKSSAGPSRSSSCSLFSKTRGAVELQRDGGRARSAGCGCCCLAVSCWRRARTMQIAFKALAQLIRRLSHISQQRDLNMTTLMVTYLNAEGATFDREYTFRSISLSARRGVSSVFNRRGPVPSSDPQPFACVQYCASAIRPASIWLFPPPKPRGDWRREELHQYRRVDFLRGRLIIAPLPDFGALPPRLHRTSSHTRWRSRAQPHPARRSFSEDRGSSSLR